MNENSKLLPAILVVGGFALMFGLLGGFIWSSLKPDKPEILPELKGVSITHEYYSTSTANMSDVAEKASRFDQVIATTTSHHFSITLGSVTITSSTAKWMEIYDATSSAAIDEGTYPKLITKIATSTDEGTLTFDTILEYGLVLRIPEIFNGDYVVTWRR